MTTTKPLNIEILFDPMHEAAVGGLTMDFSRHEVLPDDDWVMWVKRTFNMPHLFRYFHKDTGNLVLAAWVFKGRYAIELEAWDPESEAKPSPDSLRSRLRKADDMARDSIRRMKDRATRKRLDREEKLTQRNDVSAWAKRNGNEATARRLDAGGHFATAKEGGDEMAEYTGDLLNQARGRVITHG